MIYVFCGMPLAGKSTITKIVSSKTGVKRLDKDEHIRELLFGNPGSVDDTLSGNFDQESQACYRTLFYLANEFLAVGRHLIISAPFVRKKNQDLLYTYRYQHPLMAKIIECEIFDRTEEEVVERLAARNSDPAYAGGLRTLEEYRKLKVSRSPLACPRYRLNTSSPKTAEICADEVIRVFELSPK